MAKTKYHHIKVTDKEWTAIVNAVETHAAMHGTLDREFNKECLDGGKAINSVLKRNELRLKQ